MKSITLEMIKNSLLSGEEKVEALRTYYQGDLSCAFVSGETNLTDTELAGSIQSVHEMGDLGDKESLPRKREFLESIGLTREAILFLFDGGYCGKNDFMKAISQIDRTGLRPSQVKALDALLEYIRHHPDGTSPIEGIIKLPTGVGKTRRSLEVVKALKKNTMFLAPTRDLVAQTATAYLGEFEPDQIITIPTCEYNSTTRIYELSKTPPSAKEIFYKAIVKIQKNSHKQYVLVTSYDSGLSVSRSEEQQLLSQLAQHIQILINDEAHRLTGESTKDFIDMMISAIEQHYQPINLLLTATPNRKNISLREYYDMICSVTIQEAIDEGSIQKPRFKQTGIAEYVHQGNRPTDSDVESASVESLIDGRPVHDVLLESYKQELKTYGYLPSGYFVANNDQANVVLQACHNLGLRAKICTNESIKQDASNSVAQIQDDIRNNRIDIVITVKKLAEGFDEKLLRGAIRGFASRDPVAMIQTNGRALRICRPEDIPESLVMAVSQKPPFAGKTPAVIRNMLSKGEHNTIIFEPEMWMMKPDINIKSEVKKEGGKTIVKSNKQAGIEYLVNSQQIMIEYGELTGEVLIEDEGKVSIMLEPTQMEWVDLETGEVWVKVINGIKYQGFSGYTLLNRLEKNQAIPKQASVRGQKGVRLYSKDDVEIAIGNKIEIILGPSEEERIDPKTRKTWIKVVSGAVYQGVNGHTLLSRLEKNQAIQKQALVKGQKVVRLYSKDDVEIAIGNKIEITLGPSEEERTDIEGKIWIKIVNGDKYEGISGQTLLKKLAIAGIPYKQALVKGHNTTFKLYSKEDVERALGNKPDITLEPAQTERTDPETGKIWIKISKGTEYEGIKGGTLLQRLENIKAISKQVLVKIKNTPARLYSKEDVERVLGNKPNIILEPTQTERTDPETGKTWIKVTRLTQYKEIYGYTFLEQLGKNNIQLKKASIQGQSNKVSLYSKEDVDEVIGIVLEPTQIERIEPETGKTWIKVIHSGIYGGFTGNAVLKRLEKNKTISKQALVKGQSKKVSLYSKEDVDEVIGIVLEPTQTERTDPNTMIIWIKIVSGAVYQGVNGYTLLKRLEKNQAIPKQASVRGQNTKVNLYNKEDLEKVLANKSRK